MPNKTGLMAIASIVACMVICACGGFQLGLSVGAVSTEKRVEIEKRLSAVEEIVSSTARKVRSVESSVYKGR